MASQVASWQTPVLVMSAWLLLFWLVTAIEPFNRRDWLLEKRLVFFYCGLLLVTYPRFRFSVRSYLLFMIFMNLHLIGAHYTYSEVRSASGCRMRSGWGAQPLRPHRTLLFGLLMASSGFYEVMEGIVAMIVSPELGMVHPGTQGDPWDSQQDTFLAFSGAVMSMTMTAMGEIFKGSVTNENHLSPTPLRLPLRLGYLSTTP